MNSKFSEKRFYNPEYFMPEISNRAALPYVFSDPAHFREQKLREQKLPSCNHSHFYYAAMHDMRVSELNPVEKFTFEMWEHCRNSLFH